MRVDFRALSAESIPSAEFCVVGSGPAGMTLALELGRNNRSVILLEGGGESWSQESQDVYKGDVFGHPYYDLDFARLRYLGGSSGHWEGVCRFLDAVDFRKKKSFEKAHWPIEKTDLDPFLDRARSILELPRVPDDKKLEADPDLKEIHFSQSPYVRFGEKYRDEIGTSKKVTLMTHANLTNLDSDGQKVASATIADFNGRAAAIRARYFVLAMGGIENSRILMWCNQASNGKLVDGRSPLGRYWMEHPHATIGEALVDLKLPHRRIFSLTEEAQARLSVLNCGLRLEPMEGEGTKKLVKDLMCVAPRVGRWAASLAGKNLVCGTTVRVAWEQEPREENRIELSRTKRDRLGIPLTELHWRLSERDYSTARKTVLKFNEHLMRGNHGRLKLHDWALGTADFPGSAVTGGYHHLGGTRMAESPSGGVVDSNCRVFGQDNLYIAGSSVFPSGGHANPTLTIVQLSLRLAQHLLEA